MITRNTPFVAYVTQADSRNRKIHCAEESVAVVPLGICESLLVVRFMCVRPSSPIHTFPVHQIEARPLSPGSRPCDLRDEGFVVRSVHALVIGSGLESHDATRIFSFSKFFGDGGAGTCCGTSRRVSPAFKCSAKKRKWPKWANCSSCIIRGPDRKQRPGKNGCRMHRD